MLIEFGEAAENYDFDPPDSPEPVISGVRWLRSLAETGHDVARDTWNDEWHKKEPFTSEGFLRPILHDLDGLEQFARQAAARGEKLIGMWVP